MLITPKEYLTHHCQNTGTNLKYLLSWLGCGKTPVTFCHCFDMWEKPNYPLLRLEYRKKIWTNFLLCWYLWKL